MTLPAGCGGTSPLWPSTEAGKRRIEVVEFVQICRAMRYRRDNC